MYKKTAIALRTYVKNIISTLEVYDASIPFKESDNYCAFYILNLTPTSPHENLIGTEQIDSDTKAFNYNKAKYINVRVDFRGSNYQENMNSFENFFLQEDKRDILKNSGFGFLGMSAISPITSLRDVKVKQGLSTTIKLIKNEKVVEQSQIIKTFDVKVSNKI